jgi:hypothetical protein
MAAFAYTIVALLIGLKLAQVIWQSRFSARTGRNPSELWNASPPRPAEPKTPSFPNGFYIDGQGVVRAGTLGIPSSPDALKTLQETLQNRVGKPATEEDYKRLPQFTLNTASR